MMLGWPLGCLVGSVVVFLEGVHLVGAVVGVPVVWWLLLVCLLELVRGCLVGVVVEVPGAWWLLLVCLLELVRGCLMGVVVGVLWPGCEGGWVGEDMVCLVGVCRLGCDWFVLGLRYG